MAREFSTSLTATVYRYLELTDLACCMIWSESGRAKWYVRSNNFRLPLPIEELPAQPSLASKIFSGQRVPDDLIEVPPEAWLNRRDVGSVRRLLEHSISLPFYGAVISFLQLESERNDSLDEGEDALLEDLDPSRYDSRLRRRR